MAMFVSVVCDFSNDDHQKRVHDLLIEYGFKKVMDSTFETFSIKEEYLARLKRDIDRRTDSYDVIRIYQYPLEQTLVITMLKEKRWRRIVLNT